MRPDGTKDAESAITVDPWFSHLSCGVSGTPSRAYDGSARWFWKFTEGGELATGRMFCSDVYLPADLGCCTSRHNFSLLLWLLATYRWSPFALGVATTSEAYVWDVSIALCHYQNSCREQG